MWLCSPNLRSYTDTADCSHYGDCDADTDAVAVAAAVVAVDSTTTRAADDVVMTNAGAIGTI